MGMLEVALASGRMGCGNVGGSAGIWQDGVWECWWWHWHLTGWGVGALKVALTSGRMGCGNAGGSAGTGTWQDGVWECWR